LQVFTGTALRRVTLRITRRQTPAAARAHGHGHSHGDGGHEHGQDYDDKDDVNIHSHTWPPKAGETWKNFKPVEKKEPGDRLAEVLDVIRNAKYESISRNQGRDDLAMRLAAAEQENEKLTEEVKKLEVVNEKAAQELLKDAEELAFMSVRLENLEKEAEALKDLNVKLVKAADQLAVMVGNNDVASTTATHLDHDLTALRMEADSAKDALATAEARAAAERSDLIARIRTLEIDLAEAEGEAEEAAEVGAMVIGGAATAGAELEKARLTVEKLSALAKRRGDELLAAEAAASAAAREVASLKEQLANSSAGTANSSAGTGHLARVRELEVLMSEMLTTEEANVLEARIRELEIIMADMIEPEELDAALARIRSLEIVMADMVDAEELEAAEARATEMEARAAALEVEADRLRARVRALEAEMAGMSYDDGEDLAVAPVEPRKGGTFKRRSGQFTMRKFDFAAVKAKTAPVKAFKRSGTFSLRRMKFSPKAAATSAAPAKKVERSVEEPVVFNFEQKKPGFKRTPGTFTKRKLSFGEPKVVASEPSTFKRSGTFTLRKFDFAAVRAKTAPAKAFKRSGVFSLRKMKFTVRPAQTTSGAGFTRKSGQFTMRKFDFVAAKVKAQEGKSFKRGGNFTLRKMNFRENAQQEIALETRSGTFVRSGGNFTMRRFDFLKAR